MSIKNNINDFKESTPEHYLNVVAFFKDASEGKHHTTGTKVPPSMCTWIKSFGSGEGIPSHWPYSRIEVIPSENPSDVDKWLENMDVLVKSFLHQSISYIQSERTLRSCNLEIAKLQSELEELTHWTQANLYREDKHVRIEELRQQIEKKRVTSSSLRDITLALGSSLTYMLRA